MTNQLYKIKTKNSILVVDWILSNVCNFKCTYCTPDSNGGDLYWPDIEKCETIIKRITEQSNHDYRIYTILGGEPTVWKHFTRLSKIIKEVDPNSMVNILTNGSRTLKWWSRTKPYLDKVSISYHHQEADVDHTIEVVNEIQNECQTNIQMLMDINEWDKCVSIFEKLRDNTVVPIQIKKLQVEFGKRDWMEYTEEQKKWMQQAHKSTAFRPSTKRNKTSLGINCYYTDGTVTSETNHDLIQSGKNKFKGWSCNIGRDLVVIKANGDVVPANACNQQVVMGNIKTDPSTINLLTNPIVCDYNECTCGSDIEIDKEILR
jgi:MoaA/NifB/PqqE/SkfB family radical SAM enzyme